MSLKFFLPKFSGKKFSQDESVHIMMEVSPKTKNVSRKCLN